MASPIVHRWYYICYTTSLSLVKTSEYLFTYETVLIRKYKFEVFRMKYVNIRAYEIVFIWLEYSQQYY